ncbi:uncharacterized protein TrAtP1_003276 [Trichoderma atroviride]|uniref:Cell surface protein n=1 Tax=Hypocrea atroviridis (strain ATCC 20476 / IMI 206040) TaxID=452589 RepID=G9NVP2_HYPAI|nr:uncharacterized protein TRIATDRAFT_318608 [Trichoderma atroviride IMI 206040]EHK45061.1 hypothetical protein TRIATDRAFT_318608 [Trichoderma atroviride IMI 206040]UKZ62016.1 hypothetical protein TrAtP1_003276 [Trichoderma atroviride]
MSSLIDKVKDKLSSHSDNKTEQPESTHGTHSSRTANAADPRIDSDRDHREALGRHDGAYTTGGDNYSYGESNTKGMNTAGDTLTSSGTTGPAPTTAGMHKSDMMNKADPRIDSDLDGSKNMGLRSEKATHAGTTSSTYGTGTTTTGSSTGTSGTGTTFGSTGPASKTAGAHKSDTMNKADPRIDSDLDGSRNMGLRSEKQTRDTGATSGYGVGTTTTSTGNTYSSTQPGSKSAGVHKSDALNKADPRIDSDLDGSRNMGLRSEQATHDLGTTRTAGTSGATTGTGFGTGMGTDTLGAGSGINTSGRSGDYTSGTSGLGTRSSGTDTYSGLGNTSSLGSGTDTYSGMGKTSGLGSGTGTGAYSGVDTTSGYGTGNLGSGERNLGQQTGTLGSDTTTSAYGGMGSTGTGFGSERHATGPASNTAGPHKSDMMNKADPRVDSDLNNSKTFGGDKTYQS